MQGSLSLSRSFWISLVQGLSLLYNVYYHKICVHVYIVFMFMYRIEESVDVKKYKTPGDLIPELRLLWTTGEAGVKVRYIFVKNILYIASSSCTGMHYQLIILNETGCFWSILWKELFNFLGTL